MPFKLAQTFFIDPATIQNSADVSITAVDLYFKTKPRPSNNKSGIVNPGVEVYIVGTKNSIPLIDSILSTTTGYARLEYPAIRATADASDETKFVFKRPVKVQTNREYAIVLKFDGNEDFTMWTSKQGDYLVGTKKPSPGPSGKYIGNYYTYVDKPISLDRFSPSGTTIAHTDPGVQPDLADPWHKISGISSEPNLSWKPLSDTDLKFKVYVARYFESGSAVVGGSTGSTVNNGGVSTGSGAYNFNLNPNHHEYILYDRTISKMNGVKGGEQVYQRTVYYPGGFSNSTVGASQALSVSVTEGSDIVTANTRLPNGALFDWNSVLSQANDEYIIIDLQDDTADKRMTAVKKVVSIESATRIKVDDAFEISNNSAKFFISPVGVVTSNDRSKTFGKQSDLLTLNFSNANVSHRFVNNTIESIGVKAGGTGYSNSDYIIINGYENVGYEVRGGYPARANLVTNSSGAIQQIYMSNLGCGFVNTAWINNSNVVIANSSGGSTAGSGAKFTYNIGATLGSEYHGDDGKGGYFKNCKVINLDIGHMKHDIHLHSPSGTVYDMFHQLPFYTMKSANTQSGFKYHVHTDPNKGVKQVKPFHKHDANFDLLPVLPSRSNQFVITNGISVTTNTSIGGSNTTIKFTSNNDFVCIDIPPTSHATHYSKYIINNDYTNENTDDGEAFAKHITKKVNFANNKFAEDLVVYLTAYRPANTDIKVFARIHNSNDTEAFDDKDWTMLEQTDGINLFSSPDNQNDYIELTYGFQAHPNTVITIDGSSTIADVDTVTVTGSGTTYATNTAIALQTGDLIKISQPLFPDSYVVRVVDSVTSDTQFLINKPVANSDLVGSGLRVDFLGRVTNSTSSSLGYPLQAFNNITNDNVVRYYNSSMVEFDTFNTMQIKIVLLSDAAADGVNSVFPKVDDIRAVGVST